MKEYDKAIDLTTKAIELASVTAQGNNRINKTIVIALIVSLVATNLAWGAAFIMRDYYYFTTDYEYYTGTTNVNENINENRNVD